MAQAQDVAANTVSGLQPLSYLNTNQPANVLKVSFGRSPTESDKRYKIGTIWLDTKDLKVFALIRVQNNEAFWSLLGQGTGDVESFTGNTGDKVFPKPDGNVAIVGSGNINVEGNFPTSTLIISDSGGFDFPITEFVVGPSGKADFQTIQAAIDAASTAGKGTVYIQPDTYVEDLTLKDKVELTGVVGSGETGSVTIDGTHTPPTSGSIAIRNVLLKDASAIFSSVAGGTTQIVLQNVTINMTNGLTFDLLNWNGVLAAFNVFTPSATDDGWIKNTGGSLVVMSSVEVGAGSGQVMQVSGPTSIFSSAIGCPVSFETGVNATIEQTSFLNEVRLDNNSVGSIKNCVINAGSNAVIMDSSGDWTLADTLIDTSASPAIDGTGAGTLRIEDLSFLLNSEIAPALTIARGTTVNGVVRATSFEVDEPLAGLKLSMTFLEAQGADANIPITIKPKGTGDVLIQDGDLAIQTVGEGLEIKEGANARMGVATLVLSIAVVANTTVTATTRIFLTSQGGGTGSSALRISARTPGVSFTISSGSIGDTDDIAWLLMEPF